MSDSTVPLSGTCTICHSPPKYICPRCSTRTCSLPCVRVHKSRSLCSGVRNPGAYLKRHELATPKAFDQDFNFIAGLERRLESSERDLDARGVSIHGTTQGGKRGVAKGEVPIKKVLEDSEIRVKKAPVGLERARRNETRWLPKTKTVLWSVEWVESGERGYGAAKDTLPIGQSWRFYWEKSRKGRVGRGVSGKQRELIPQDEAQTSNLEINVQATEAQEQSGLEPGNGAGDKIVLDTGKDEWQFLLHVPGVSRGNLKTVVLLDPNITLREALRGSELLEFPTIEATTTKPEQLDTSLYAVFRNHLALGRNDCKVNGAPGSTKRSTDDVEANVDISRTVKLAKVEHA